MYRLLTVLVLAAGLVASIGCSGGSNLNRDSADVFITANIDTYNPDINVCALTGDINFTTFILESNPKNPDATLNSNQDARLTDWEVTVRRTDGGSVTSPDWYNPITAFVPAGGTTTLSNYRVYPEEYLGDAPFNYLYPENGGVDAETGQPIIREAFRIVIYGRLVSGKSISTTPVEAGFSFYCN